MSRLVPSSSSEDEADEPAAPSPVNVQKKTRFQCPADFVSFCHKPCSSTKTDKLTDGNTEIWLIKAPASFDPQCFSSVEVSLSGLQTLQVPAAGGGAKSGSGQQIYSILASTRGTSELRLLSSHSQSDDVVCGPAFSGLLNVCESYGDCSANQAPQVIPAAPPPSIPPGLKQRFHPFGSRMPTLTCMANSEDDVSAFGPSSTTLYPRVVKRLQQDVREDEDVAERAAVAAAMAAVQAAGAVAAVEAVMAVEEERKKKKKKKKEKRMKEEEEVVRVKKERLQQDVREEEVAAVFDGATFEPLSSTLYPKVVKRLQEDEEEDEGAVAAFEAIGPSSSTLHPRGVKRLQEEVEAMEAAAAVDGSTFGPSSATLYPRGVKQFQEEEESKKKKKKKKEKRLKMALEEEEEVVKNEPVVDIPIMETVLMELPSQDDDVSEKRKKKRKKKDRERVEVEAEEEAERRVKQEVVTVKCEPVDTSDVDADVSGKKKKKKKKSKMGED